MQFIDKVPLTGTRKTHDGYLTAEVKVARTGVQSYLGSELGKPDIPVVNVFRGEDEVFNKASMASFVGKPVTMNHPKEVVTADNWKDYAVGQIGQDIARDGEAIRLSLALMDAKAITKVEDGSQRELSVGYRADIEWVDGITADGITYQARQKNIFVDHLAVVPAARAGKEFRIGDADTWGAAPITQTTHKETVKMTDANRTVVVDGLSVVTTDQGAQAIEKLQGVIRDALASNAQQVKDHAAAIALKDGEIGELKAKVKELTDAAPKPADLDRLVRDRATLVAIAGKVDAKIVTDGKTDLEIKRAVVASKFGDEFVKDSSDAEIAGMFKTVSHDAKPADRMVGTLPLGDVDGGRDKAYRDSVADLTNAWKSKESA